MSQTEPQRWLGYLRGSRTGTLFLGEAADGNLILSIGFTGGGDLRLRAERSEGADSIGLFIENTDELFGTANIEHESDDSITGSWRFSSGAEGVFELTRHQDQTNPLPPANVPDQLRNIESPLGAVTLYRADLERLIAELESLVPQPNITTIRAVEDGQIVIEPASRYLSRKDYVDVVRTMTLSTAETTSAPLRKIANISLNDDGSSQIFVTSPDEIWTEAVAHRLEKYLTQFSSRFTGILRKHGLNINSFILFSILLWMPDRPLFERIIVFLIGICVMLIIAKSHSLLPYNRVYLDPDRQKRPFAKEIPGASIAALAGIVTAGLSAAPQLFESAGRYLKIVQHLLGF